MILLRDGFKDVNTSNKGALDRAKKELLELNDAVNVKVSVLDYQKVPEGSAWIHQAWSGDFVSAQYYLPKGVDYTVLGYWYPEDKSGLVGSDLIAILRSSKNPVLAHHFLNFMLDDQNAYDNFVNFVGYQPPQNSINPDRLVTDEVVPQHLASCVVRPEDFDKGEILLELDPATDLVWQDAWAQFKAGVKA
jgi:spermidine/putrescine transport system substrate-binding protein